MPLKHSLLFAGFLALFSTTLFGQRIPLRMEVYPQVNFYGNPEWEGDLLYGIGATLLRQIKEKGALKTGIQYGIAPLHPGSISLANLETGLGIYSQNDQGGFFGDFLIKGGLERTIILLQVNGLESKVARNEFFLGFELGAGYNWTFVSGLNLGLRIGTGLGTIDIEQDPLFFLRGGLVFSYQLN